MLDIGWTEIMLIAGVAVLVISPKDLPRALRTVGQWVGKAQRMARGFRRQIDDAIRETELDDLRATVSDIKSIDPLADTRKTLADVEASIKTPLADKTDTSGSEPPESPEPAPASAAESDAKA